MFRSPHRPLDRNNIEYPSPRDLFAEVPQTVEESETTEEETSTMTDTLTMASTIDSDDDLYEEDMCGGMRTPIAANYSKTAATTPATVGSEESKGTFMIEEEEEDELESLADSWEPLGDRSTQTVDSTDAIRGDPITGDLGVDFDHPQVLFLQEKRAEINKAAAVIQAKRSSIAQAAAAVGKAFEENRVKTTPSSPVYSSPSIEKPAKHSKRILFVTVFFVTFAFGLLVATGVLDYYLEAGIRKSRDRNSTGDTEENVKKLTGNATDSLAPTATPVEDNKPTVATFIETVQPVASTMASVVEDAVQPTASAVYESTTSDTNDSKSFAWLSPDDDVLAGRVFWENETDKNNNLLKSKPTSSFSSTLWKKSKPAKKQVNQEEDVISLDIHDQPLTRPPTPFSSTLWKDKLQEIRTQSARLKDAKERPNQAVLAGKWVGRHYHRLNVYVLGQSQLTQIKQQKSQWLLAQLGQSQLMQIKQQKAQWL